MQGNKGRGTRPEKAMGRLLWSSGIRYRKNQRGVPGTPDFCIKKYRLAIFVDGEFWHGRNWEVKKRALKGNREFWVAKIERNMRRDRLVTSQLEAAGWKVFRFWESDIKKRPGVCLGAVLRYLSRFIGAPAPTYVPMDYREWGLLSPRPVEEGESTALEAAEPGMPYGAPLADDEQP